MGARGHFFARCIDNDLKHQVVVMKDAAAHKGTSVVEVLQNCVIFNDKTHEAVTAKAFRADRTIYLEQGKPMVFGTDSNKGLRLNGLALEVVTIGENGITEKDLFVITSYSIHYTKLYDFDQFNPFELKRSAGVGLRIFLPMFGLMGIDWGHRFDDSVYGNDAGGNEFHFVMGQSF